MARTKAIVLITGGHDWQFSQEIPFYALYCSSSGHREPDFRRGPPQFPVGVLLEF